MHAICSQISTHSQTVKVIAIALSLLLVTMGIFQLYRPFLTQSPAAGWALIMVGASVAVLPVALSFFRPKKKPLIIKDYQPLKPFPKDIWLHILSFLDPKSLAKFQRVSKDFYVLTNEKCVWQKLMNSENPKQDCIQVEKFREGIQYHQVKCIQKLEKWFKFSVSSICSANGMLFVGGEEYVYLWAMHDGKWIYKEKKKCDEYCRVAALIYRNPHLFTGSVGSIKIWKVENESLIYENTFKDSDCGTSLLSFADDTLFSCSNYTIKIWHEQKQNEWICIQDGITTYGYISSICSFQKWLFFAMEFVILAYKLDDKCFFELSNEGHSCTQLCFANDLGFLFSGNTEYLKMWKFQENRWQCVASISCSTYSLCYSNQMLFRSSRLSSIIIYKVKETLGEPSYLFDRSDKLKPCFANGYLITGSKKGNLSVWGRKTQ